MPKLYLTCQYCGHKWEYLFYGLGELDNILCTICQDSNIIKEQKPEKCDVYGYDYKKD